MKAEEIENLTIDFEKVADRFLALLRKTQAITGEAFGGNNLSKKDREILDEFESVAVSLGSIPKNIIRWIEKNQEYLRNLMR